jgi:hypothetical protein
VSRRDRSRTLLLTTCCSFFDYAYIHLPLLDPSQNTATAVCARSPFLFTVICAVASRFHVDPNLHIKCYDEAHECFVECVAGSERSIESVQACMILTVWTNAPKKSEDRPQRAWLYFGMVRSFYFLLAVPVLTRWTAGRPNGT